MAKRGRPMSVEAMLGRLKCGPAAKERMLVILGNLTSEIPLSEACQRLGLSPTFFRRLRRSLLRAGLRAVEPRPRGRPIRDVSRHERRIIELERKISELEEDLAFAHLREELALVAPWTGRRQKKKGRISSFKRGTPRSKPPDGSIPGASHGPDSLDDSA